MKLKALRNILHDGVTYGPNEEFEVTNDKQAQILIEDGAAEKIISTKGEKAEKQLKDMTKKELMEVAQAENIEGIDEKMINADIIEIIEAARKA